MAAECFILILYYHEGKGKIAISKKKRGDNQVISYLNAAVLAGKKRGEGNSQKRGVRRAGGRKRKKGREKKGLPSISGRRAIRREGEGKENSTSPGLLIFSTGCREKGAQRKRTKRRGGSLVPRVRKGGKGKLKVSKTEPMEPKSA